MDPLVAEVKRIAEDALDPSDTLAENVEAVQNELDDLVSSKRKKGVHMRAEASALPGGGIELQVVLPVTMQRVKLQIALERDVDDEPTQPGVKHPAPPEE